jgi:hypothetical protein
LHTAAPDKKKNLQVSTRVISEAKCGTGKLPGKVAIVCLVAVVFVARERARERESERASERARERAREQEIYERERKKESDAVEDVRVVLSRSFFVCAHTVTHTRTPTFYK